MSNTGKNTNRSTENKKAAVLGTGKNRRTRFILALAVALAAAGAGLYLIRDSGPGPAQARTAEAAQAGLEEFSYPVSDFEDGKAKYFTYRTPRGLTIRYFIMKSTDGVIRAALDACDTCWSSGKGYRQESDTMACNNCGLKFPSNRINEVKGGCNPAPLTRKIVGDQVIIKARDIVREGSFYFDYDRRG